MPAQPNMDAERLDFRCHKGLSRLVKIEAQKRGLPVSIWLRLVLEERLRALGYDVPDAPAPKAAGRKPTARKPRPARNRKPDA